MDITISPVIGLLVPIVIGLVSLLKNYIDAYYAPLASLVLGIGSSFLLPQATWQASLLVGVIVALSAAGLYSSGKTIAGN